MFQLDCIQLQVTKILNRVLNNCYLSHITISLGKGGPMVIQLLRYVIRDDSWCYLSSCSTSPVCEFSPAGCKLAIKPQDFIFQGGKRGKAKPKAFSLFSLSFYLGRERHLENFITSYLLELMHPCCKRGQDIEYFSFSASLVEKIIEKKRG